MSSLPITGSTAIHLLGLTLAVGPCCSHRVPAVPASPADGEAAEAALARGGAGADEALERLERVLAADLFRAEDLRQRPGLVPLIEDPDARPRWSRMLRDHADGHTARLAVPHEPGVPLRVAVRLETAEGRPAAGALVFVYHAAADGRYTRTAREPGQGNDNPRLFWWLRADDAGRIEVETILPGAYGGAPPHFHLGVVPDGTADGPRTGGSLYFRCGSQWTIHPEIAADAAAGVAWLVELAREADGFSGQGVLRLRAPGRR